MKKTIFIFINFISVSTFSQVEKIEPPFWWIGMNNTELQLMVYGENIADYDVSISNDIRIINTQKTENSNYQFVTINAESIIPGIVSISFSKKGKVIQTVSYEFKERRKNSALRKGFDSSDVIYLIMPDRFAEIIKDAKSGKEIISDKLINLISILKVEGKSSMIIELNN